MVNDTFSSLRIRRSDESEKLDRSRLGRSSGGAPAFVGRVVASPTPAILPSRYFAVHPVSVLGTEIEAGSPDFIVDPSTTVLVCILGSNPPAVGDDLICRFIGHRWIAEPRRIGTGGTGGGGAIPGCVCVNIPAVLTMTPGTFCGNVFQTCTLRWGPTPADLASLPLGANCYLSDEQFYHDLSQTYYRWYLECRTAFFGVRRAFLPAGGGGPYLDATFFLWSIGVTGNGCTPFLLSNGQIYPGGDARCILTISE